MRDFSELRKIPGDTIGLRLCKIVRGKLIMTEEVIFKEGKDSVNTVLRRASLSGRVGKIRDLWKKSNSEGDFVAEADAAKGEYKEIM